MNNVIGFYERQLGNYNGQNYDTALKRLCVHESDSWKGIAPSTYGADFNPEPPIFTAKFANTENYRHILAIANEDGKIALQDTNLRSGEPENERTLEGQQCHHNAVFDLEWMPNEMKFVSASGDHTARLWEVCESSFIESRVFNGHSRSVKTAAFRKNDSAVFATGGRDGAILIWDTRATLNVGAIPRADNCIYSGHAGGPGTPQSFKRRTRQTPKLPPNVSSSSITGLVFQDDHTLVSCGAGDGIIKVWDLRRNYTSYKKEPLPKHSIPYPGTSTFKGYTNLMVDNSGYKLYVNCMDNNIYCYNLATYSPDPLIHYVGLRNSTFYIKSSLSPDGQYLLSGSSDEKAYIWNVNNSQPLVSLVGHTVEVTCVAWSRTQDMRIITCSDDARHKIWRIGPEFIENDQKTSYRGNAECCKDYKINQLKVRLKAMENTPKSIKRLVERNETTPSSTEKVSLKRTFGEMMCFGAGGSGDLQCYENEGGSDQKRPHIETRGRRLFSPSASSSFFVKTIEKNCSSNLASILEETDSPPPCTSTTTSVIKQINGKVLILSPPLSERINCTIKSPETNFLQQENSPPFSAPFVAQRPSTSAAAFSQPFSPTSNLPNFVVSGEAPHLPTQSPKRKLKENVDWLTKIRKQKLMSSINSQLNDKLNQAINGGDSFASTADITSDYASNNCSGVLASPRLQSLKSSERSPSVGIPKRRSSRSGSHHSQNPSSPKTPNRRNSETTILRFFSIQHTKQSSSSSSSPTSPLGFTGTQSTLVSGTNATATSTVPTISTTQANSVV